MVSAVTIRGQFAREAAGMEDSWSSGAGGEHGVVSGRGYFGGMGDDDAWGDGGDGGSPDLNLDLEGKFWELGK